MSRFLYLMRHAQSADKQPGQPDKERELTQQGVQDAMLAGKYLQHQKIIPEIIISSTAIRAKHTAELVIDVCKLMTEKLLLEEELYNASVRTFLEFVNQLEDSYQAIMCVGHNPVISYLAEYLTKAEIGDMPPAGLAVIRFNALQWKEINQGSGTLDIFLTPANLHHGE